jgi:hypothetical protein
MPSSVTLIVTARDNDGTVVAGPAELEARETGDPFAPYASDGKLIPFHFHTPTSMDVVWVDFATAEGEILCSRELFTTVGEGRTLILGPGRIWTIGQGADS